MHTTDNLRWCMLLNFILVCVCCKDAKNMRLVEVDVTLEHGRLEDVANAWVYSTIWLLSVVCMTCVFYELWILSRAYDVALCLRMIITTSRKYLYALVQVALYDNESVDHKAYTHFEWVSQGEKKVSLSLFRWHRCSLPFRLSDVLSSLYRLYVLLLCLTTGRGKCMDGANPGSSVCM